MSSVPRAIPTAPRCSRRANNLSGQLRLSWLAPASIGGLAVTDYVVQRSPNGTSGWVTLNDGVRTTTTSTVTALANGTRDYFRVFARNAAGQSVGSNVASAIPRTVPRHRLSLIVIPNGVSGQLLVFFLPTSIERRFTGHRLRRPGFAQRYVGLGHAPRWSHNDHVGHGDRVDRWFPLLLPGCSPATLAGTGPPSNVADRDPSKRVADRQGPGSER